jgi:hypothetical protein
MGTSDDSFFHNYSNSSSNDEQDILSESEESDGVAGGRAGNFASGNISNKFLAYKLASTIKKIINYDGGEYERHRIFFSYYLTMKMALKEPRNLYFMTPITTNLDQTQQNQVAKKINTPTSPKTLGNAFKALRYYN